MHDEEPKSAYELAMERLRKKDADEGVSERPLSDQDKAAIAELRTVYQSKVAQEEIMHRSRLARTPDPAEREVLDAQYRHERERLATERDDKIQRIRIGIRDS